MQTRNHCLYYLCIRIEYKSDAISSAHPRGIVYNSFVPHNRTRDKRKEIEIQ